MTVAKFSILHSLVYVLINSLQAIISFGFNRTLVLTAGGKVLVVGAGEVTFVSQSDRASLASSQMDPLVAKAEPIITYLRKDKKMWCGSC